MNRRQFLTTSSLLSVGLATQSVLPNFAFAGGNKLKILVLGGRDFFGPTLVETLISMGHQVTLFNRGFTNAHLFPHLTWIKGDREVADGSGFANLKQHLVSHKYDWVIDTWQKLPTAVRDTAKVLKPHIGQYHYVSSISVYKDKATAQIDENYPLKDLSKSNIENPRLPYSERKAWSETALFDELGDKVTTFRSHGMRSDRTPSRIYEPYWPSRFLAGGEILLPKDKDHVMQVCDVKSMIDFMILAQSKGLSGAFNVARETRTFSEYIDDVTSVTKTSHEKVWIPKTFLANEGIEPYRDLPFWRPQLPGFYHINVEKALKAGLKNRSIQAMVTDQLTGYLRRNPNQDYFFGARGTISRQKEAKVIAKWRQNNPVV